MLDNTYIVNDDDLKKFVAITQSVYKDDAERMIKRIKEREYTVPNYHRCKICEECLYEKYKKDIINDVLVLLNEEIGLVHIRDVQEKLIELRD